MDVKGSATPQHVERQWSKAVLAAVVGKTESDSAVRVEFDTPYRAAVTLRPCPDAHGRLVLMLTVAHDLQDAARAAYRLALVSAAGLRHGQVDYAACLCQAAEETVLARFSVSMLEQQSLCDILAEMLNITQDAMCCVSSGRDVTNDADTDMLVYGGVRV